MLDSGAAREGLRWSRQVLDRLLLRLRWRWGRRHILCLGEVGEVRCPVSLSSHGKAAGPSLEAVVVEIAEMVEGQEEVRSRWLKMTGRDSEVVLEATYTQILTTSRILVVVLMGSDTFQLAQDCVVAVVNHCSRHCWFAKDVDCVLAKNSKPIARRL